ncbi:MAG TPA: DUF1585 domain-containing protein, partial [Candidatus Obscuribacter sp.]|nr:DUF1585 domain-containing protein [Candidatus Obscuribacter sp.]
RPTTKLRGRPIHEYRLGPAVDSSGELPDGRKFAGIEEFKQLLSADAEQVARSLPGRLLTYATGASVQFADRGLVEEILRKTKPGGRKFPEKYQMK